jgi:hypothetical protein
VAAQALVGHAGGEGGARRTRKYTAGSRLGKTAANRSPKASRLKPVDGEMSAAPSSRQNGGVAPPSSSRLAMRNNDSPTKLPPIPVVI